MIWRKSDELILCVCVCGCALDTRPKPAAEEHCVNTPKQLGNEWNGAKTQDPETRNHLGYESNCPAEMKKESVQNTFSTAVHKESLIEMPRSSQKSLIIFRKAKGRGMSSHADTSS